VVVSFAPAGSAAVAGSAWLLTLGYSEAALAAGFDAYVAKPVNIRELLDTLKALFARADS